MSEAKNNQGRLLGENEPQMIRLGGKDIMRKGTLGKNVELPHKG